MKPLSSTQRTALERVASKYAEALGGSPAAEYLEGRGIGLASGVPERYGLGYVAEEIPGFERFVGMVSIPNYCASGHVVGIKFRSLDPEAKQRYDQPHGQQSRLFNLRALNTAADWIVLTEGEFDAMVVEQLLGDVGASAAPGTNTWKRHHAKIFEGYRRVVVLRDNDSAGSTLVGEILRTDLDVVVVAPPHGAKDANEALLAGYGDDLAEILRKVGEESLAEDALH